MNTGSEAGSQTVDERYIAAWQDLKRRWRLCLFLWLGYLPIGGGLGIGLGVLFDSDIPFAIVGGAWFLSIPITYIWLLCFRCPRCQKLFFFGLPQNPFKFKCGRCGIRPGVTHDSGRLAEDMAAINKRGKKIGLAGFIAGCLVLSLIAIAGTIASQQMARPKQVAEQFLQLIQTQQYEQARNLLSPSEKPKLTVANLQRQSRVAFVPHQSTLKPKFSGAANLPIKTVSVFYEIPHPHGTSSGAKLEMVKGGDDWQIEAVTFYKTKDEMLPTKTKSQTEPR